MLGSPYEMDIRRDIRIMEKNRREEKERQNRQTKWTIGTIIGICGVTYLSRNKIYAIFYNFLRNIK